jgi:hypothetical protein
MPKANRYIENVSKLLPTPTVATELLGLFGDLGNQVAHCLVDQKPGVAELPASVAESLELLNLTARDLPGLLEQSKAGLERVQGLLQLGG